MLKMTKEEFHQEGRALRRAAVHVVKERVKVVVVRPPDGKYRVFLTPSNQKPRTW